MCELVCNVSSLHSTAVPPTCLFRMCLLTPMTSASHGWPSLQSGKCRNKLWKLCRYNLPSSSPPGGSRHCRSSHGTTTMMQVQLKGRTSSASVGPPTAEDVCSSVTVHLIHFILCFMLLSNCFTRQRLDLMFQEIKLYTLALKLSTKHKHALFACCICIIIIGLIITAPLYTGRIM